MTDAAQQLQDLVATPRILEIRGRKIELRPPRPFTDEFVKILRLLGPMVPTFSSESGEVDIGMLLTEHGERVRPLCALLAGVDEEWLTKLEFDEAVLLVKALIEENLDFFVNRMVPALGNAASGLTGKWSTMSQTIRTAATEPTAPVGPTPPSS